MAERRMLSKTLVDSDEFLDMPVSTQNLYFHLNLRADDEGFIDNPKTIMRTVSAGNNDLDILLAKRYILKFDSGVIVIKHWKLHNSIRKDRAKETLYKEEKKQIVEKENGVYTDNIKSLQYNDIEDVSTNCQPNDNQLTTKCPRSIGKVRLVEDRIEEKEKINKKENSPFNAYKPPEEIDLSSNPLQRIINHWNSKENIPKTKYDCFGMPNNSDIVRKFAHYSEDEILKSIDNLDSVYLDITGGKPTNFTNYFVNNSIDSWVDIANPLDRYNKPIDKEKITHEEVMAIHRYFKIHDKEPKSMNELREFIGQEHNND